MNETQLSQPSIKFLRETESPDAPGRQIDSSAKSTQLPEGFAVIPMVVLEKPEPIKPRPKKR
jgi:hypothetical protein